MYDDAVWESNNTDDKDVPTSSLANQYDTSYSNVELEDGKGCFNDFNEFVVELDDDDDKIMNDANEYKNDNDEDCYANDYSDEEEGDYNGCGISDDGENEEDIHDYIEGQGYEKNWSGDGEDEEDLDYDQDQ